MTTFRSDLLLAMRLLTKKPGFTVVAVLTLALGIAVNATMFSMVSAFLLRRPAGWEPERIVVITSVSPNAVFRPDTYTVSVPNYLAWRAANDVFTDIAAADEYRTANLGGIAQADATGESTTSGQPEALPSAAASSNYFSVLGVSAQIGRTFTEGIGLVLALPLPKVFEAMFEGLKLGEPSLYFLMPLVLLVVAMLATYVPARRATRVDPMRALRQE